MLAQNNRWSPAATYRPGDLPLIPGEAAVIMSMVRAMRSGDLPAVASVTDAAFAGLHPRDGRAIRAAAPVPALLIRTRLAADPAGCFVAVSEQDPGRITGALLSVARGTLGWFGPLAVHPQAQRCGVGMRLVAACVDSWRRRGVHLMGLATFSAAHPTGTSTAGQASARPAAASASAPTWPPPACPMA